MRYVVAAFLLLSLATATPLSGQSPRNPSKEEPKAESANASSGQKQTPPKAPPPPVVNQPSAAIRQNTTSEQGRAPDHNGSVDWIMWSAIVQAVCAAVVAGFTGVLLLYSHRGWRVAKEAADAAKDSADVAKLMERPWVTATLTARSQLIVNDVSGWLICDLVLENIGHSAATNIRHHVELTPVAGPADIARAQQAIASKLAASERVGFSLFPGETGPMFVYGEVIGDEFTNRINTHFDGKRYISLCLVGVVAYRFATSDSEHTTKFAFYVSAKEPSSDQTQVQLGQTILEANVAFYKEYDASHAD